MTIRLSVAIFFCVCTTWALPKGPALSGESSGAGEIPDELLPEFRPFDGPLGKGFPNKEVFNDYDLDAEEDPEIIPDHDTNDIHPQDRPQEERPFVPDDRIPEEEHPEDEPKEEEEEDHEPPSSDKPIEEETHDDEEDEAENKEDGGEKRMPEEEDTHDVEDEEKVVEEEDTKEGKEEVPFPLNPALFSFQQVNHYIKLLEKAMEHVFQETLDEASLLNNTFTNTTEEEVEVNGHKYKVHKSLLKTEDEDKNSTLLIEAIHSVIEEEPKKNRTERSNPDSEPNQ